MWQGVIVWPECRTTNSGSPSLDGMRHCTLRRDRSRPSTTSVSTDPRDDGGVACWTSCFRLRTPASSLEVLRDRLLGFTRVTVIHLRRILLPWIPLALAVCLSPNFMLQVRPSTGAWVNLRRTSATLGPWTRLRLGAGSKFSSQTTSRRLRTALYPRQTTKFAVPAVATRCSVRLRWPLVVRREFLTRSLKWCNSCLGSRGRSCWWFQMFFE
mmetsp:Transcript_61159/g.162500  ORF Transcript_61159/g.162500 Transcript_61159/m.162500 type:complete len:212 (+) Transcript_61159:649-1284(+)